MKEKVNSRKIVAIFAVIVCAVCFSCILISCSSISSKLPSWNKDAVSLKTISAYVDDVTKKSSENYIPESDRIVVMDMDGTVYGEREPLSLYSMFFAYRVLHDPSYVCQDQTFINAANRIEASITTKETDEDICTPIMYRYFEPFYGMTFDEFNDCITRFLDTKVIGYENTTYKDLYYVPMKELIKYLEDNNFQVYICTGSSRSVARQLMSICFNLPYDHIIGIDVNLKASNQGNTDDMKYVFGENDTLVVSPGEMDFNINQIKVANIIKCIGKRPVMVFGNGGTDISMMQFAINDNPYKTCMFYVINDNFDAEVNASEKDVEKAIKTADKYGFTKISTKNDWNCLFDKKVTRSK